MVRTKYSIIAADSVSADYFLFGLEWSKKYDESIKKICSDDISAIEIIETFAKIPIEIDCTETVYSFIFSRSPDVYFKHSDFIQYIVESLMQEYYNGIEKTLQLLRLSIENEYTFVRLFDPTTALIRIDRTPDLRINERSQWQNILHLT